MVKQIIVIRKDLKMRRGKEIAQGSHASMKWIVDRIAEYQAYKFSEPPRFTEAEQEWLSGKFTKVCLQVNSEAELLAICEIARDVNIQCSLITDAGATEFHGVPTNTCCALGPDHAEIIDPITSHLKLY